MIAACIGIILLSSNPHGSEELKDLLAGQILWVGYQQLLPIAIISTLVLGMWFALNHKRHPMLFYGIFAISITSSVQLVGIYLVFASLIMPALCIRQIKRNSLVIGFLCGAMGYAVGLCFSALMDWPSGASIVMALALSSILFGGMINSVIHTSK